jgi:hypothetical protein
MTVPDEIDYESITAGFVACDYDCKLSTWCVLSKEESEDSVPVPK